MRRFGVLSAVVGLLALAGGSSVGAKPLQANCTLSSRTPVWVDFADGSVPFWQMFAKPGVVAAASNLIYPSRLRAGGAQTVYFDLHLNKRVGTPSAPADTAGIVGKANKFYEYAAQSMDCSNPVIAENELFGAWTATPWSPTMAQYRANVLLFLQTLRARGAQPWLLVNSSPYTAGEAGDWWRAVTDVAGIVREVYFPAPLLYQRGPVFASRTLRQSFRKGILDFTRIGVPVSKLGIYLGFQTTKGTGGREGLAAQPWFRTVKWQVLAARYVAREMHVHSIWSWGWAEWKTTPGEHDPEKRIAACVYLWTRDPHLCNGPAAAGKGFVRSLAEGQPTLAAGLRCSFPGAAVGWAAINPVVRLSGDPELAFSAAFARAIEQRTAHVTSSEILAAERSLISGRFGGSRGAYLAAIAAARTNLAAARAVIGDQLRRARIALRLRVSTPSPQQIADYQDSYGDLQARLVQTSAVASWLGGRRVGYGLESTAPGALMGLPTKRWSSVWSPFGAMRVRPLAPPEPLAGIPLAGARPSIRAALIAQARDTRFPEWLTAEQLRSFPEGTCWRDRFPEPGEVDLTAYLPFLEL
ncbi:MAG TPA: hypothetical protein VEL10_07525 [Gaiellaceae bacterium]|nr:hypothetical protein [Gaiellaceae bacterium]